MNYCKMNKCGTEKLMSIWWFAAVAIVGVAIVIGVWIYHSAEININEFQADELAERLIDCMSNGVYFDENFLEEDIFERCNLRKEIFEKPSKFYFKISFEETYNLIEREPIEFGNSAYEKECDVESKISAKHFPQCSVRSEDFFYNTFVIRINILTAVNQEAEREG